MSLLLSSRLVIRSDAALFAVVSRQQLRHPDGPQTRCRREDLDDRLLRGLGHHLLVGRLLQLHQGVVLLAGPDRGAPTGGREPGQPALPPTPTVDAITGRRDATAAIHRLQAVLHPDDVLHQHRVHPTEIPQPRQASLSEP